MKYSRKQIQEAIEYWSNELNKYTVFRVKNDLQNALFELQNNKRGADISKSCLHVGPKGSHIGDISDVYEDNGVVVLEIKRDKNGRRGSVVGCKTIREIISKLEAFDDKPVVMRIPYDALTSVMRRKDYEEIQIGMIDSSDLGGYGASISGIWIRPYDEPLNEGYNDLRLPRDHVKRHATGKPIKYWVGIEDYSETLTNYGHYVDQNLRLIPVGNNSVPPSTIDINKVRELARRVVSKWPNKYVIIGTDDTSRGKETHKNHLRGGGVIDCWIPEMNYWRDGFVESSMVAENESSYITPFCHDANENGPITTVGKLKQILQNFDDNDVIIACDQNGDPSFNIKAIWNSNYEYEMTGSDSGNDHECYIRIG